MFHMEGSLHQDYFLVFDVGDGSLGRYRRPEEIMKALMMYRFKTGGHEINSDNRGKGFGVMPDYFRKDGGFGY